MDYEKILAVSALLMLAALWNFSLFDKGQYTFDVKIVQQWGNVAREEGISALYVEDKLFSERKTTYPPLYLYILTFNSWVSEQLFNDTTPMTVNYNRISKTIPVLCNLLIALVLFVLFNRESFKKGLLAMSLYAFNPATTYVTAFWGQIDAANTLFVFLCIVFLLKRLYLVSSIFLTLSVLTKIQSIVIAPVFLVMLIQDFKQVLNLRKIGAILLANGAVVCIVLAPIILHGMVFRLWGTLLNSVGFAPFATVNAHNMWYLITPGNPDDWQNLLHDTQLVGGVTYKTVGLVLFALSVLVFMYLLWKKKISADSAAAGIIFSFFLLPTQIHERYLYPFFAIACIGAVQSRRMLVIYCLATLTFLLNAVWVLPFANNDFIFSSVQMVLNALNENLSVTGAGMLIAAANILIFLYYVYAAVEKQSLRRVKVGKSSGNALMQ